MTTDPTTEFARQVRVMLDAGVPALAGMTPPAFVALVDPLRSVASDCEGTWLIALSPGLIAAEQLVPLLRLPTGSTGSGPGVVDRNHGEDPLATYQPLPQLRVPDAPAYLVADVDRGDEFRGVRPRDAVETLLTRGRTPLTIHEGIALALQHPMSLQRNHCFMLAGSRRADKRVPALWISDGAPKLGWCWEGNPHAWLGTASAGRRVASHQT